MKKKIKTCFLGAMIAIGFSVCAEIKTLTPSLEQILSEINSGNLKVLEKCKMPLETDLPKEKGNCSFKKANDIYDIFTQFYEKLDFSCLRDIKPNELQSSLGVKVVDKRRYWRTSYSSDSSDSLANQSDLLEGIKIFRFSDEWRIIANNNYLSKNISIFPNNKFPNVPYPKVTRFRSMIFEDAGGTLPSPQIAGDLQPLEHPFKQLYTWKKNSKKSIKMNNYGWNGISHIIVDLDKPTCKKTVNQNIE